MLILGQIGSISLTPKLATTFSFFSFYLAFPSTFDVGTGTAEAAN